MSICRPARQWVTSKSKPFVTLRALSFVPVGVCYVSFSKADYTPSAAMFVIVVVGKKIPAGSFVSSIVHETVHGMLGSLRGYEPGKEVEIRLEAGKGGV